MLAKIKSLGKSDLLKNSFWGLVSNVTQNLFLSVFFVMIARHYATADFAHYLIANTLYQLIASFSALGLGQWFIREIVNTNDKAKLVNTFVKIQFYFGVFFFVVNVALGLLLYEDPHIRTLSLLFGLNIVFDNIIYSIRNINIAESTQKRTFIISIIEAIIKFLVACLLFAYPFSITTLAVVLIAIRLGTLGLFLRIGASGNLNLTHFWRSKVQFAQIRELVVSNWSFIVIGSVAIIYWRIAHIIISKTLTLKDVAHYEISFKLFSLAQLIPLVVSTTVFPSLIKLYNAGDRAAFGALYKNVFKVYMLFGLFSFSFIYAFSDVLIPLAFGDAYADTAFYTKQMFLTILVFPTAYLQANLLVAMRLERFDMWFNILSLAANLVLIFVGLYFVRSLLVINYSIFLSFFAFHVAQDVLLVRKNISTRKETFLFYAVGMGVTGAFIYLCSLVSPYLVFAGAWLIFLVFVLPNTAQFKAYMGSLRNHSNQ